MKKILAFAGSNSSTSINHSLLSGLIQGVTGADVELIKLIDFPLPMFSEDLEQQQGYPQALRSLHQKIRQADGLIISVNEHNGTVSAFFKNVLDWLSRIEYKFLDGKRVLLLSTSNGKRGARSALEYTAAVLPRFNGQVSNSIPVPEYNQVFDLASRSIRDPELARQLKEAIHALVGELG